MINIFIVLTREIFFVPHIKFISSCHSVISSIYMNVSNNICRYREGYEDIMLSVCSIGLNTDFTRFFGLQAF